MASRIFRILKVYGKIFALFFSILLGLIFSQAKELSVFIKYLLMVMLFFAFLDAKIKTQKIPLSIFFILLANVVIAFVGYWLLIPVNNDLALAAFITGIAPTAIASPIIIGFLNKNVEYVIVAVLLTNVASGIIVPLALPWLAREIISTSVWSLLKPTLMVMFVPFIFSQLVGRLSPTVHKCIQKGKRLSYPLWLITIFIISAKTAYFVRFDYLGSSLILLQMAVLALTICVINFLIGALIGSNQYWQEASQALGQKNNSFVVWISLTFLNPLIALGPTFYIIYHNLYNAFQIYIFEKNRYLNKE